MYLLPYNHFLQARQMQLSLPEVLLLSFLDQSAQSPVPLHYLFCADLLHYQLQPDLALIEEYLPPTLCI